MIDDTRPAPQAWPPRSPSSPSPSSRSAPGPRSACRRDSRRRSTSPARASPPGARRGASPPRRRWCSTTREPLPGAHRRPLPERRDGRPHARVPRAAGRRAPHARHRVPVPLRAAPAQRPGGRRPQRGSSCSSRPSTATGGSAFSIGMIDGRAELFAGGTPPRDQAPLLRQPEGVGGRLGRTALRRRSGIGARGPPRSRRAASLDPRYVVGAAAPGAGDGCTDTLWIGADGNAEAPWQQGPGEIWRVPPDGSPALLLRGPIPAAIAASPGGHLFVADRQGSRAVRRHAGRPAHPVRRPTARATRRAGSRSPPTRPRRAGAGIAGDLFVATINQGAWPVNEVVRISGPFDSSIRQRPPSALTSFALSARARPAFPGSDRLGTLLASRQPGRVEGPAGP